MSGLQETRLPHPPGEEVLVAGAGRPFEAYPDTILETDALIYEVVTNWNAYKVARVRLAEDYTNVNADLMEAAGLVFRSKVTALRRHLRLLQQCRHIKGGALRTREHARGLVKGA